MSPLQAVVKVLGRPHYLNSFCLAFSLFYVEYTMSIKCSLTTMCTSIPLPPTGWMGGRYGMGVSICTFYSLQFARGAGRKALKIIQPFQESNGQKKGWRRALGRRATCYFVCVEDVVQLTGSSSEGLGPWFESDIYFTMTLEHCKSIIEGKYNNM